MAKGKTTVYDVITDIIIDKLKQGVIPWKKSYRGVDVPPMNFKTKNKYNGINVLLLNMVGAKSPYFMSYKQAESLGGQVKKGSKGNKIIFAKNYERKNKETGEMEEAFAYRYSHVYSLDVIEGIECPYLAQQEELHQVDPNKNIDACELLVESLLSKSLIPKIEFHDKYRAFYNVGKDRIFTCGINDYISSEEYYGTVFHEIIHSTGHKSRLDRRFGTIGINSKTYAKEELVAEIGACFMCQATGIVTATIDNSAAYIQSWLKALKDDPKLVIQASKKAQDAVNYLQVQMLDETEFLIPEENETNS